MRRRKNTEREREGEAEEEMLTIPQNKQMKNFLISRKRMYQSMDAAEETRATGTKKS